MRKRCGVMAASLGLLVVLGACATAGADSANAAPVPPWLQAQLDESAHSRYPAWTGVRSWKHQGQAYYLLQAGCCDRFNELRDATGQYLCAPSGGFTGQGDGRCGNWRQVLQAGENAARRIWPREGAGGTP